MKSVVSPALLFTAVTLMAAPRSEACGGFFCDGGGVLQAAERIVFVDDGEGHITAVVQIQYTGPADAFAWVLPVPGIPQVGVSSNVAFTRLQQATEPRFNLVREFEGDCSFAPVTDVDSDSGGGPPNAGEGEGESVTVVGEGSVGPYDYEIIQVDMNVEDKAAVAIEWLQDNGYQQPPQTAAVLGPYLDDNKNLIAFRLNKSADAGAIRPVVLRYDLPHSKIPIRPTAVAANPDMGVMTWVVAPARAVPTNYRHAIINDAAIDWFTSGSNYNAVVTQAANEGDGQAFVTEDARETNNLGLVVHPQFERDAWALLRNNMGQTDLDFVEGVYFRYASFDGLRDVLQSVVVPPAEVTFGDWFSCADCYMRASLVDGFDREDFEAAVDEQVFAPLREMAELLESQAVVTRMYTTMSADEMTLDPVFEYNPTLPMVSNIHTATQVISCTDTQVTSTVTLPNGLVITIPPEAFVWPIGLNEVPAAEVLRLEDTTGAGMDLVDERANIRRYVEQRNLENSAAGVNPRQPNDVALRGGCNCGQAGAAFLPVALLGLLRRRRRSS
jgi:uncharacterized protein (TIGR03382 family)